MKEKKILQGELRSKRGHPGVKDILKLHPELKKDKALLKKTVKFLAASKPDVMIDAKFKSDLGERLSTLAKMKGSSVDSLKKKSMFVHIFGGVFASLLAFFGLFYVLGDSLFYSSDIPRISEYEAQISDVDVIQETKLEIKSTTGISEPSTKEDKTVREVPNTIIIDEDGASQVDVSESQKILPARDTSESKLKSEEKRVVETSPTQEIQVEIPESRESVEGDSVEAFQGDSYPTGEDELGNMGEQDLSGTIDSIDDAAGIPEETLPNMDSMDPAAGSMMAPAMMSDLDDTVQDGVENAPDAIEETIEIQEESQDEEILDEFTLRCDVFGGEVMIEDDIRICRIGDIVCKESDFLKGVCELGQ